MKRLMLFFVLLLAASCSAGFIEGVHWDDGGYHELKTDAYWDTNVILDLNAVNQPGTHLDIVDGAKTGIVRAYNYSTVTMSGGRLESHLQAIHHANINVSGGFVGGALQATQFATISMTGGTADWLQAEDYASITINGGTVVRMVRAYDSGKIYLDGSDFMVNGTALKNGDKVSDFATLYYKEKYNSYGGTITGVLADGSPLEASIVVVNNGIHAGDADIIIIPEPCTLVLLSTGLLLVGRRRRLRV